MAKHNWRECDWIIYRCDDYRGDNIKCCAVGSSEAARMLHPVVRGFHGTYPEVKKLVEDLNSKAKVKTIRHYVRKEKEL